MNREELLRSARNLYENPGTNEALKVVLEETYPELKEREDERIRKELKEAFESYDIESEWNGIPIRSIFAWLEKQKEQKPAEWSEEDRKMLDAIIKRYSFPIETDFSVFVGEDNLKDMREELGWLKSLRPQLKYEWSEEDEEMLDAMVDIVANSLYEPLCPRDKMLCWLKSLRPQPHWKPSEEQIGALERAIVKTHTVDDIGILAELRDNLKKL